MASFYEQHDKDENLIGWRAQVRKTGWPQQSKVFRTKKEAQNWAAVIESEMARGVWQDQTVVKQVTLGNLLERYGQEITPQKKGAAQEVYRLAGLKAAPMAKLSVGKITGKVIAHWRDDRLIQVTGSTVNRDMNLLGHVFEVARKEWGYPIQNPCRDIRRPKHNPARTRRVGEEEVTWLLQAMEHCRAPFLRPVFLLSLATAMRRGEVLNLDWQYVDLDGRTAWLPDTKTDEARHVPLSSEAIRILRDWREYSGNVTGPVFIVTGNAVRLAWQRTVYRAKKLYEADCEQRNIEPDPMMLMDLHFHDTRHEATSRAFEKGLNVMEVATVTGHKDLRSLKRYTQLRAEDVARKLG